MATVPTIPQLGQPIDVQYLNDIVQSLISINSELAKKTSATAYVNNGVNKDSTKQTSNLSISATTTSVSTNQTVTANLTITKVINFQISFKFPPIVTATPVSKNNANITVIVNSVDSKSATCTLIFNQAGTATVDLNVIAVGIPSQ
jgi:hypothetical protein